MVRHAETQTVSGSKAAITPGVTSAIARSVIAQPPRGMASGQPLYGWGDGVIFGAAFAADGMPAWGNNVVYRDRMLRNFIPTESTLAGAFATVIARNAAFSWKLDGGTTGVDHAHELLQTANEGKGYLDLITKLCWDLYTQDKGAFMETIRMADNPASPVIGLASLDAGRCWLTGRPDVPVIYSDIWGKWHELKWYQVVHIAEMPAPHETLYGLQYCSLTRTLAAAQLFRNIQTYMVEKTGGRQSRAIHIVSNVKGSELQAAVNGWGATADNQGLTQYVKPIVLAALNDQAPVVATLAMASLPDGFDVEVEHRRYLQILSTALGVDYQELSPLPHGGLGSASQSEILDEKSRGKGAALFRAVMEQAFNFSGIFLGDTQFAWDEQDPSADDLAARTRQVRVATRAAAITSGELDVMAARQQALDAGDISQEEFDALNARDGGNPVKDVTPDSFFEEGNTPTDTAPGRGRGTTAADPNGASRAEEDVSAAKAARLIVDALGAKASTPDEVSLRDFLISRLHRSFTIAADDMRAMGYLGTDERIKISGLIGEVLSEATRIFDAGDVDALTRTLAADDGRLILSGMKELNPDLAGPSAERLDFERVFATELKGALDNAGEKLTAALVAAS